jgi:pilus assembly protein Flp/PilA
MKERTVTMLFQSLFTLAVTAGDRITDRLTDLKRDETGASAVEYAILVGLLAAAVIVAVTAFSGRLSTLFSGIKLG